MLQKQNLEKRISEFEEWSTRPRFNHIKRLHTSQDVILQQGSIIEHYKFQSQLADEFYTHLRDLFQQKKSVTTFGPYSPGQLVVMKKLGISVGYLGGWAESARGSTTENPGADLASYPLNHVPESAAMYVRALLTADKIQFNERSRLSEEERKQKPEYDFRPFLMVDGDAGHGGEAHVSNLIRRFVEAGVVCVHIEDQKAGTKKCGHQAGKVLVSINTHIRRLNTARLQFDIMNVAGLIVSRTDAESASFIEDANDERDHPFILGATNTDIPSFKSCFVALMNHLNDLGVDDVQGHLLFGLSDLSLSKAHNWLKTVGLLKSIETSVNNYKKSKIRDIDSFLDPILDDFLNKWQDEARLATFSEVVTDAMEIGLEDGESFNITIEEWEEFASKASFYDANEKIRLMGINITWDIDLPRTTEGYYPIRNGIDFSIARSLAFAPFADLLWMETKTANLQDAKKFSRAIHSVYPEKMLTYNLSPSFNWDATGMAENEMKDFSIELGKIGFVLNFITYGGHQIDGLAAEQFTTALIQDGPLALARLQRELRLRNSDYRTPQKLVGGNFLDHKLMSSTGRTASTRAMGKRSTHHQHLLQIEVPTKLLEEWLEIWLKHYKFEDKLKVYLRPHTSWTEALELRILNSSGELKASVVLRPLQDRLKQSYLSIIDQNAYEEQFRKKRLMTLIHLFLIHRYKAKRIHYVNPTEDNLYQTGKMKHHGIFSEVTEDLGHIIVAIVNQDRITELIKPDRSALIKLIKKIDPPSKTTN
jgi:isocitrate lyase